jgi:hypothetical protein
MPRIDMREKIILISACVGAAVLTSPGSLPSLNTLSRLRPRQIARASSGRTPATKAHNNAGVHQPRRTPRTLRSPRSSSDGVPAAVRRTGWPEECSPGRWDAYHIRGHAPVVPGCGSRFSD